MPPTVSVSPWITIDARITKAAVSKIALASPTSELRTSSAKRIPATPLGPNHAMKARCDAGRPTRTKERPIAMGRATSSANAMKAISRGTLAWYPVATISAPKAKKVSTCRIELTFSLKTTKSSAIA